MSGSYLLHPHIPVNGTALLPQLAEKAKNSQNEAPGAIYIFLNAVTGAFIITAPGVFGVTIGTDGNDPKK
jgi:hypothetical protein